MEAEHTVQIKVKLPSVIPYFQTMYLYVSLNIQGVSNARDFF